MKIGILADIHIDVSNYHEVRYAISHFITKCLEDEVRNVIIAGDLFLIRKHQTSTGLELMRDLLDDFYDAGISTHIIAGNHDKVDQSRHFSYVSMFNRPPDYDDPNSSAGIFVYDFPNDINLRVNDTDSNVNFIMLPFYSKDEYINNLELAKSYIDDDKINICITHQDIDVPSPQSMRSDDFSDFQMVLSGHHHDARIVRKENPLIMYIGSPIQFDFSEDANKGGIILDTESLDYERVPLPFKKYITVNGMLGISTLEGTFKSAKAHIDDPEVKNVRIKLTGSRSEYNEHSYEIRELESLGIDVICDVDDELILTSAQTQIHTSESLKEELRSFAESKGKDPDEAVEVHEKYSSI